MNGNELSVQQVTHCLPAMFNRWCTRRLWV